MISHAAESRINIFSIVYLVMCIERRHEHDFATYASNLRVEEVSNNANKGAVENINQQGSK
jgi:hypothetical protein